MLPEPQELLPFWGTRTPDTPEQAALRRRLEGELDRERDPQWVRDNAGMLDAQWEWAKHIKLV